MTLIASATPMYAPRHSGAGLANKGHPSRISDFGGEISYASFGGLASMRSDDTAKA